MKNPETKMRSIELPDDSKQLPTVHVASYVRRLAARHRVSYTRSRLEDWAESVSRAAGDDVHTDETMGLLVRLKQRRVLTGEQFTRLLLNHYRETQRV